MMLCFYCNMDNANKRYTSQRGGQIYLHDKCVEPMKKLVKENLFEYRRV